MSNPRPYAWLTYDGATNVSAREGNLIVAFPDAEEKVKLHPKMTKGKLRDIRRRIQLYGKGRLNLELDFQDRVIYVGCWGPSEGGNRKEYRKRRFPDGKGMHPHEIRKRRQR